MIVAQIYRREEVTVVVRGQGGVHVCWLRKRGATPSFPLGSLARSLLHAVLVPSDPSYLVCPVVRGKGGVGSRTTDRRKEKDRTRREGAGRSVVQPIWDVLHRQLVPEVTDKADPISVESLKVPRKKIRFRKE